MHQKKSFLLSFLPDNTSAGQRLDALKQALIDQGVPSGHQLYLQVPKYEDLFVGVWPDLYCSDADILLAASVLIAW